MKADSYGEADDILQIISEQGLSAREDGHHRLNLAVKLPQSFGSGPLFFDGAAEMAVLAAGVAGVGKLERDGERSVPQIVPKTQSAQTQRSHLGHASVSRLSILRFVAGAVNMIYSDWLLFFPRLRAIP
jgi:hypothetical protein